jgi:FkbM family methyltransferase
MEKEILSQMASEINSHRELLNRLMKRSNIQELELNLLRSHSDSKSQYSQDLFVLKQTDYKTGGFFVEFGACDGIAGSNTYILENKFEWNGILAEPCRKWWSSLQKNRRSNVDFRCVYSESNLVLDFTESINSMLSTLTTYQNSDNHSENRKIGTQKQYPVVTVSLNDLLNFYDAPKEIDYISIDTEGSEYEILSTFDFTKYKVKIITVEHNWTNNRQKIFDLLHANGYEQVHNNATMCDDWYVLK